MRQRVLSSTGDEGCRTTSTNIKITTRQGKNNTTPRGTEMAEFPRNRSGRRKKASLDVRDVRSFGLLSSTASTGLGAGVRRSTLCTKLMAAVAGMSPQLERKG